MSLKNKFRRFMEKKSKSDEQSQKSRYHFICYEYWIVLFICRSFFLYRDRWSRGRNLFGRKDRTTLQRERGRKKQNEERSMIGMGSLWQKMPLLTQSKQSFQKLILLVTKNCMPKKRTLTKSPRY